MEVLLDTHIWAWMLAEDPQLNNRVRDAIERADKVRLSPVTFFEIGQKTRLGKWPSMESKLDQLTDLAQGQGILTAPFTPDVALFASRLTWHHRDPFDRILAATAILSGISLISADSMFDTLEDPRFQRIR